MKISVSKVFSELDQEEIITTTYSPDAEDDCESVLQKVREIYSGQAVVRYVQFYNVKVIERCKKYNMKRSKNERY